MSPGIRFPMRTIKIAKLLKSQIMVGRFRGEETWTALRKIIPEVSDRTMVLIDILDAMPLQYTFCQYAFGPLFEAINNGEWPQTYVLFRMKDFHRAGFFRGVLKHLGSQLPRKEAEKEFVSARFYTKLITGDEESIEFIGRLTEAQERTLAVVNELREVTVRDVTQKLGSPEENVVDELRFLVKKYFVVLLDDRPRETPHYVSLLQFLYREAIQ